MSIARRDYLLRVIEQFGEFVARLMNLKAEQKHEDALRELDELVTKLFGAQKTMLPKVDVTTAAMLLGDAHAIIVYAWLLRQRADLDEARGDHLVARAGYKRAIELAATGKTKGGMFEDLREILGQVARDIPVGMLDDKQLVMQRSLAPKEAP